MSERELIEKLEELKVDYNQDQLKLLKDFYELLKLENQKTNLTRIIEEKEVYLKHFYDSLTILKIKDLNQTKKICDVGTGAGFPGIVLKIFFPNLNITLIDSNNKKIKFLQKVIEELNLKNIKAIKTRVEEHVEKYDLIVTRAVAKINVLVELCIPLLEINGELLIMKANAEEEIVDSKNALKELKSKIIKIERFKLPIEQSNRTLILIKKEAKTPEKYPRKYDRILKKPL